MHDATAQHPAGQVITAHPPVRGILASELKALHNCETVIERGLVTFIEVGKALIVIRDKSLFRHKYNTFREYCAGRWHFSDSRARQLIAAAKVADEVQTVTNVTPPNEAVARELNRLPKDQQAGAWQDIVAEAGGAEKVTATRVKATVDLWLADNEPFEPAQNDGADEDQEHDDLERGEDGDGRDHQEDDDPRLAKLAGLPEWTIGDYRFLRAEDPALYAKVWSGEINLHDAVEIVNKRLAGYGDQDPADPADALPADVQVGAGLPADPVQDEHGDDVGHDDPGADDHAADDRRRADGTVSVDQWMRSFVRILKNRCQSQHQTVRNSLKMLTDAGLQKSEPARLLEVLEGSLTDVVVWALREEERLTKQDAEE